MVIVENDFVEARARRCGVDRAFRVDHVVWFEAVGPVIVEGA